MKPASPLTVFRFCASALILLLAGAGAQPLRAAPKAEISYEEAQANFVVICAYFTTWPESIDPQRTKVLRIGVLGTDDLHDSLTLAAARARSTWFTDGKIILLSGTTPAELADCQIILITDPREKTLSDALAFFAYRPVVLVGSAPDFVRRGGTVAVRLEKQSLAFDINLDQLKAQNLELSPKFLSKAAAFIRDGKRVPNKSLPEVRP